MSVTAVITAMTDAEEQFLPETLDAVLADPEIDQIVLCVEENNRWVDAPERVDVLRLPMMYSGGARNRGVAAAKHDWIAFCDGDDVWMPGKTSAMLEFARKQGADIVASCHFLTDEDGNIRANGFAQRVPMTSSWIVARHVFETVSFDESMPVAQDVDWWRRTRGFRKARCPKRLLKYRVRRASASSKVRSKRRKETFVHLGSLPVVGRLVYFATWCRWLSLRTQTTY